MAKSKQHRALFEVLLKNHAQEASTPTVPAKPGPAPAPGAEAAKPPGAPSRPAS